MLLLILAAGCHKTGEFYNQLDLLPQIDKLDNTAYAVGDTLTLTGKLGTGKADVQITIGNVDAPVITILTTDSTYIENEVLYNYTKDRIKVLITEGMIGPQQLVVAKVNGVSSVLASIFVSRGRPLPALSDTLNYLDTKQAEIVLSMPEGTRVIPNYTPGGAIVFMNGNDLVTWQEGEIRRGKVTWKDSYGDFTILDPVNPEYGFASDPAGDNLYISCLTSDAGLPGAEYSAIRLMKISLRDYSITTLNRTVLPTATGLIDDTYLNLDTAKREGNIGGVFLPVMKKIYVNSQGELYFSGPSFNWYAMDGLVYSNVPTNLTVAHLNAAGNFRYLAKGAVYENKIFQVFVIKNGEFNMDYDFIPNVTSLFSYSRLAFIDAENSLLYGYAGMEAGILYYISTFYCYNLAQQRQVGEFTYKLSNSSPTVTDGPFNIVEGNYSEETAGTRIFQWPAPGQPTVMFARQQQLEQPDEDRGGGFKSVKAIDFTNHSVSTYALYRERPDPAGIYRLGMGGDVVGYTASKKPLMVRTNEVDANIHEVLLLAPVK